MTSVALTTQKSHTPVPINYTLTNGTPAQLAEAVTEQWQRAQDGLIEILKFGALMIRIDTRLGDGNKRSGEYKGPTLKSWLKDNCPEINYNTAMGYKTAALGLAAAAELPDNMPLLQLMEGDRAFEDDYAEAHARVMDIVSTASISWLKTAGRGPGRPEGSVNPPRKPTTMAQQEEMATIELEELIIAMGEFFARERHLYIMDQTRRQTCRLRLLDLADLLK